MKIMTNKVLLSWGGGKDSALALYETRKEGKYDVMAVLTTITKNYKRISMHGVREDLLRKQASSLGIPLEKVYISKDGSNDEYENKMRDILKRYQAKGVVSVLFGDIFLEDVSK